MHACKGGNLAHSSVKYWFCMWRTRATKNLHCNVKSSYVSLEICVLLIRWMLDWIKITIVFIFLSCWVLYAVQWLEDSSSLGDQGVNDGDTLLLRKKYFVQNDDVKEAIGGNSLLLELIYQQVFHSLNGMHDNSYCTHDMDTT